MNLLNIVESIRQKVFRAQGQASVLREAGARFHAESLEAIASGILSDLAKLEKELKGARK